MKNKDLTAILALLQQVSADPRLESVQREKLRKGRRELEKARRSGKPDHRTFFRATWMITSALVEGLIDC